MTVTAVPTSAPSARDMDLRQRLTEALLCDVVERVARRPDLWDPLVARDAARTTWARLRVREDVEVFVVTWPTFAETTLHSHGDATAAFRAIEGVVTEIRPDDHGRLLPRKFEPGLTGLIRPDEIHDIRNEHAGIAVTIHAYSPGLSALTYYSWSRGRLRAERTIHPGTADGDPGWPRDNRP